MPQLMPAPKARQIFRRTAKDRIVGRALRLISAAAALTVLSGCQGIVSSPTLSQVRVIDTSPDAPGIDVYQNNLPLIYNLGFGTITSYVPTDPATYTISTKVNGSSQVLTSGKATFVASKQYTILLGNVAASLEQTTLLDQSQAAPTGQIALRFLDQATRVGAMDVYLVPAGAKFTSVTPLVTNMTFGINTGYLNVPTGTYTIVLVPTGTIPTSSTIATYTGPQVTYTGGSASTIILIDQQLVTTPGLQVITATDFTSPTATS
jgi:Domain of unknown function (DUF4397)